MVIYFVHKLKTKNIFVNNFYYIYQYSNKKKFKLKINFQNFIHI